MLFILGYIVLTRTFGNVQLTCLCDMAMARDDDVTGSK